MYFTYTTLWRKTNLLKYSIKIYTNTLPIELFRGRQTYKNTLSIVIFGYEIELKAYSLELPYNSINSILWIWDRVNSLLLEPITN